MEDGAARRTVRRLHDAGVAILAGTDSPNPWTGFGVGLHRELELLCSSGLSPVEALTAATSASADVFQLDRGRVRVGTQADLLLVDGDPTVDIAATRNIVGVWKSGVRFDHDTYRTQLPPPPGPPTEAGPGPISDFGQGTLGTRLGVAWAVTSDASSGGQSEASLSIVSESEAGSAFLRVGGVVREGFTFPRAGVGLATTSADLTAVKGMQFWARSAQPVTIFLQAWTRRQGWPVETPVQLEETWTHHLIEFDPVDIDAGRIKTLGFVAAPPTGPFQFDLRKIELT